MNPITRKLDGLGSLIVSGKVGTARFWGGADVVISESEPSKNEPGFYPEPRVVVSPNAAELSWLFEQLRDTFSSHLDGQTKIEFFGRLANAARRYQARVNVEVTKDLLSAVLHEAYAMAEEMEEGSFESLGIAFGNEIVDDYVDEAERRGFIGVEETKRFFADKGIELR